MNSETEEIVSEHKATFFFHLVKFSLQKPCGRGPRQLALGGLACAGVLDQMASSSPFHPQLLIGLWNFNKTVRFTPLLFQPK